MLQQASQSDLLKRSEGVRASARKAWRWIAEMEKIAATFAAAGLPDGFRRRRRRGLPAARAVQGRALSADARCDDTVARARAGESRAPASASLKRRRASGAASACWGIRRRLSLEHSASVSFLRHLVISLAKTTRC